MREGGRRWAALVMAALSLNCASSSGTATYEDVCKTAHQICTAADLLCTFAPKSAVYKASPESRASQLSILMHQLDSLSLVLHNQTGR
jgi:hypothetical protein